MRLSLPALALALALPALAPRPLSARLPEDVPAPPLPAILERARALQADGAPPSSAADLAAYAAEIRGTRVAGWPAWVIGTFRVGDGATHAVRLAAEDPYAPRSERKPAPPGRIRRSSIADRPAYLLLSGLAAPPALRPGQKIYVDGTLAAVGLASGVDLTVERARFTVAPEPALPEAARGDLRDLQVSLERGPCFGRCPVYKIAVAGSLRGDVGGGTVTWSGRSFVGVTGAQRAPIDAARLRQLFAALERADFLHLRDGYENHMVTDASTTILTLRSGKQAKTVRYYHGDHSAPVKLAILENQIDAILGSAAWIEAAR